MSLRPIETSDLDFLADLANDDVVRQNVVGWGWPVAKSTQLRWYEAAMSDETTRRFVVLNEDGIRVGSAAIYDLSLASRTASVELKFGGVDGVRGRGYGLLVLEALCDFAFTDIGLQKLNAQILSSNNASRRLFLEKAGWSLEGIQRSQVYRRGRFFDLYLVGLLAEEFSQTRTDKGE